MSGIFVDTNPESLKLKQETRDNLIKELSGDFTPEQLAYLGKTFDDVASKYTFKRKNQ